MLVSYLIISVNLFFPCIAQESDRIKNAYLAYSTTFPLKNKELSLSPPPLSHILLENNNFSLNKRFLKCKKIAGSIYSSDTA